MKSSRVQAIWNCIWIAIWRISVSIRPINLEKSGTRREELLVHPDELQKIWTLRRAMTGVPANEAMELLIGKLKKIPTNIEFLLSLQG